MRRVYVTNIPVTTCIGGWVDIPDATAEEDLQKEIADSLRHTGFKWDKKIIDVAEMDLDGNALDGWEYIVGDRKSP